MNEIELTEEELDKIPNRHEIQDYLEEEGYLETKDGNLCQDATVEEIFSAGCEYILKKLKFDKMEKPNSHFINFEGLIAKGNDFKAIDWLETKTPYIWKSDEKILKFKY